MLEDVPKISRQCQRSSIFAKDKERKEIKKTITVTVVHMKMQMVTKGPCK